MNIIFSSFIIRPSSFLHAFFSRQKRLARVPHNTRLDFPQHTTIFPLGLQSACTDTELLINLDPCFTERGGRANIFVDRFICFSIYDNPRQSLPEILQLIRDHLSQTGKLRLVLTCVYFFSVFRGYFLPKKHGQ